MVRDVSDIYSTSAKQAGNTLSIRVATGLSDQWFGPIARVRQVLLNLLSNAIKHAPKSAVVISASQYAQGLVFEVSDNGPGLSEHAREHLFEPFASSLGASGSTGLGLRISKLIVQRHLNGTIYVQTEPGKGTTFVVKFPSAQQADDVTTWEYVEVKSKPVDAQAGEPSEAAVSQLAGKSLLLVDDAVVNLEALRLGLESVGLKVSIARSSQEALALVSTNKFDYALLDYNLGANSELNGIDLAKQMRDKANCRVIGFTGNCSREVGEEWRKAGVEHVVLKPVSLRSLAAILLAKSE